MTRFVHINIIAEDHEKLIDFYKVVFGCRSIGEKRNLHGQWLDKLTGVPDAHILGEHLVMPGYDADHPTLEIYSYNHIHSNSTQHINSTGISHLAFEVDDVAKTLQAILENGGSSIGEMVHADYADGRKATFVYATDIEGNIIELQSWE